jgi:hypothetical protein
MACEQLDTVAASGRKGQVQLPPAAPASANQAPRWQCLVEMVKARPLAFPDEGDTQSVPSALARGIVPKWAEANHWAGIDGVAREDVEQ